MPENSFIILVPVVDADTPIELALARAEAANAFAIVVLQDGSGKLLSVADVEDAAQRGGTLNALTGRSVSVPGAAAGVSETMRAADGNFGIRAVTDTIEITGFRDSDEFLRSWVQNSWYQCDQQKCPDKKRYRKAGTCAYNHKLAKHP
jgi:hypothetical protein